MGYNRRRYRLRQSMGEAPSKRALWTRVAFYVLILIVILIFQDSLGDSAAGCLKAFGPPQ
ncbi:MAG: hypothetical protein GXP54_03135 [Deltaproteobacteria bacterium]|nr:hypothetical protein [Deltaproteobacteria bacterium]